MAAKNNTAEKCEAILRQIVELANRDKPVTLHPDFYDNTLTVVVEGQGHSHVGVPSGSFEQLVDSLHGLLCQGRGLSWAD